MILRGDQFFDPIFGHQFVFMLDVDIEPGPILDFLFLDARRMTAKVHKGNWARIPSHKPPVLLVFSRFRGGFVIINLSSRQWDLYKNRLEEMEVLKLSYHKIYAVYIWPFFGRGIGGRYSKYGKICLHRRANIQNVGLVVSCKVAKIPSAIISGSRSWQTRIFLVHVMMGFVHTATCGIIIRGFICKILEQVATWTVADC